MTTHYKPVLPLRDTNAEDDFTEEQKYWMKMEELAVFEESCSSCDFKPCAPYALAVAGGSRVVVFDTATTEPAAIYSRFKTSLCSVKYRHDGALLGVSTSNGFIQFFDTHSEKPRKQGLRTPIRTIKAHKNEIYSFKYDPTGLKIASFSDDCYSKLFDLSIENSLPLWNCGAHTDFIRTGDFVPNNENLLITGSYDNTIRLWDTRQDGSSFIREFNHSYPVEKLLFLSSKDNIFASAGGNLIKFWDLNSGEILKELKLHKKKITSINLSKDEKYLITGSIDRRVNILNLDNNFELIHTWRLESPIKSMAIDCLDKHISFGLENNNLVIWKRKENEIKEKRRKDKRKRRRDAEQLENFVQLENVDIVEEQKEDEERPKGLIIFKNEREGEQEKIELKPTERQLEKLNLGQLDYLLREGRYQELVSIILLKIKEFSIEYIVAIFYQIRIRQQLKLSISKLEKIELCNLFNFLSNNLGNINFFDILYDVTMATLEVYIQKPLHYHIRSSIYKLQDTLQKEIESQKEFYKNCGLLEISKNSKIKNKNNGDIELNEEEEVDEEEDDEEEEDEEKIKKMEQDSSSINLQNKSTINGKIKLIKNIKKEVIEEDSEDDEEEDVDGSSDDEN